MNNFQDTVNGLTFNAKRCRCVKSKEYGRQTLIR